MTEIKVNMVNFNFSLAMPFSRDTLTELNMTLVRLSGAESLRDPLASQLLGDWVDSSPLARARWSEATEVGYASLTRDKQKEEVKQYASLLFPAPDLIRLFMDLNVPKLGFQHMSEYMSRRGSAYTAATGLPFPKPIPTRPPTFIVCGDAYRCAGGSWTNSPLGSSSTAYGAAHPRTCG